MVHQAEINYKLTVTHKTVSKDSIDEVRHYDVVLLRLPNINMKRYGKPMPKSEFKKSPLHGVCCLACDLASNVRDGTKILVMGNPLILPYIHGCLERHLKYRTWIAVKTTDKGDYDSPLSNGHDGILVYTKGEGGMEHSVMRVRYEYCKSCDKTVKDYGGKKHLYHEYGTALSDVWKDFSVSRTDEFPKRVIKRVRDLFSVNPNKSMLVMSLWDYEKIAMKKSSALDFLFPKLARTEQNNRRVVKSSMLINNDCVDELQKIQSETVDMIFVDPPYNLSKKYSHSKDNMNMQEYYKWCDRWLHELSRILKNGGSMFVLNVPKSSARHFLLLRQNLHFQNWIVWDALSTPLGTIMPAHYAILYFTKGLRPKRLNVGDPKYGNDLDLTIPMDEKFCSRPPCMKKRTEKSVRDHCQLNDLWTDIHRVKHNSLREDHPTLLPPKLLQRLILMASNRDDLILDCFNGVGTTTLVAALLGRKYLGIEKSGIYATTSKKRHAILDNGGDPFAKRKTTPSAKNSTLKRVTKYRYEVPKRTLQLEVKEISKKIGCIPGRKDVIKHSKYPIKYFDTYFRSWREVTEAAYTTGMSEIRIKKARP